MEERGEQNEDAYRPIAELYDHVPLYRDRADIAFFVDEAKRAGGRVLEVGCGTGRVLIPCARAGVEMVGVDSSQSMLDVCRRRLAAESSDVRASVELVREDMRDFAVAGRFRLVMFPFRSFQHLVAVDDQLACLQRVRDHLEDAGRVIIDVFNPSLEALASRRNGEIVAEEPEFALPDGRRVVRRHRIVEHDRVAQINHVELIYAVTHTDGRTETLVQSFAMRYFFRYEMEHLLVRSGFEVEAVHADYDRNAHGSKHPGELITVARKAA
jgi:SAM-dependent methyltransferase